MKQTEPQRENLVALVQAIRRGGKDEGVRFQFPKLKRSLRKQRKSKTGGRNHPAREAWLQKLKRKAAKAKEEVHEVEVQAENPETGIENQ